jgi:GT2 family glycosyltransferase
MTHSTNALAADRGSAPMTARTPMDVSIILVNWNALADTRRAIQTLLAHSKSTHYEIIVVDNATLSPAECAQLRLEFPKVRLIPSSVNLGFSGGCNRGLRVAQGNYLLLLNTDTIQIEDSLGASVRYMEAHPDVGALGIRHLNNDDTRSWQQSVLAFPTAAAQIRGILFRTGGGVSVHSDSEQDVDSVCGSFLMIRRACLEDVGDLDEQYFAYYEDLDWCRRAWRAGWRVRYWPGASLIHCGSAASAFISDKNFMMLRANLTYMRKNHSALEALLFHAAASLRLGLGTTLELVHFLTGRGSGRQVLERGRRQLRFMLALPPQRALSRQPRANHGRSEAE